jgi:hypothetical protein
MVMVYLKVLFQHSGYKLLRKPMKTANSLFRFEARIFRIFAIAATPT